MDLLTQSLREWGEDVVGGRDPWRQREAQTESFSPTHCSVPRLEAKLSNKRWQQSPATQNGNSQSSSNNDTNKIQKKYHSAKPFNRNAWQCRGRTGRKMVHTFNIFNGWEGRGGEGRREGRRRKRRGIISEKGTPKALV